MKQLLGHTLASLILLTTAILAGEGELNAEVAKAPPERLPEMKKLEFLLAKWTGKRKFYLPGQGLLEIVETSEGVWTPDGTAIHIQGRSEAAVDGSNEFWLTISYDPEARNYWLRTSGRQAVRWRGDFEGKKLVFRVPPTRFPDADRRMVGVGVQLDPHPTHEGLFRIVRIYPNSPAAGANLRPGDLITRVDGQSIGGMHVDQVVSLIRGKAGTTVRLSRRGNEGEQEFPLRRTSLESPVDPETRITIEPQSPTQFVFLNEEKVGDRFEKRVEAVFTARP